MTSECVVTRDNVWNSDDVTSDFKDKCDTEEAEGERTIDKSVPTDTASEWRTVELIKYEVAIIEYLKSNVDSIGA